VGGRGGEGGGGGEKGDGWDKGGGGILQAPKKGDGGRGVSAWDVRK